MTFCKCGYWATSSITQVIKCPICSASIQVLSLEDQGRYAWCRLHNEPSPTPEWYETVWLKLIPSHGCLCYSQWRLITDKLPPDFTDLEVFRLWAIAAHNEVNRHLGKPRWLGNSTDALGKSFAIRPGAIE
jgi:hypothetical protein